MTIKTTRFILLIFLALQVFHSTAQVSDSVYHKRLFYLCKAWGHAKYYHTNIAAGNIYWDDELLTALTAAKNDTDIDFDAALLQMLKNAGPMATSTHTLPAIPDSMNNNPDKSWIQDSFFTDSVRGILDTITARFRPQSNVYLTSTPGDITPGFTADKFYATGADYPAEEKRLLAMFRYWNIMNYMYPYKNIMGQNWDLILAEFIPGIAKAPDKLSYNLTFREFTSKINDSHSFFSSTTYNDWDGNYYTPFEMRVIENETVITKILPGTTGIAVGDVVKEMDGRDIYSLRDSLRKYSYGSNAVTIERNLNDLIAFGQPGSFPVKVDNGTSAHTVILSRTSSNYTDLNADHQLPYRDSVTTDGCSFGIVDMGVLQSADVPTMFNHFKNTDAIVFDIRNYPNSTLWDIVNYLFYNPIHIANFATPDTKYPGRMYWSPESIGTGASQIYHGKVILLFDERTQSQAEYTCMGIGQFPRTLKIGSTTAGADGDVAAISLPGNITAYASFLGAFYPDYTPTQRVGIIPDIELHPTIAGIRAGRDELMERAISCATLAGIKENPATLELSLFPNPVKDKVNYRIPSAENGNSLIIEIIDMQGKTLKTIEKKTGEGEIDFSGLSANTYLVKITTAKGSAVQRIVKSDR